MIQELTKLYEGSDLSGATANVIYLPILFDCNLQELDVKSDANVSGANAVFSVSHNGSTISGLSPTITVGNKIGTVSSLDIDLVKGDEIILNLTSGAVSAPVTLNLKVDDGQVVSGEGGGAEGVDTVPSSPDALDLEFDAASLPAGWTENKTGSFNSDFNTTIPGRAVIDVNDASQVYVLEGAFSPAGDFQVTFKFCFNAFATGAGSVEIGFYNTAQTEVVVTTYQFHSGDAKIAAHRVDSGSGAFFLATKVLTDITAVVLHMQRVGNDYRIYYSLDGGYTWQRLTTVNKSFTVDKIIVATSSGTISELNRVVFDWLRFNFIDLS